MANITKSKTMTIQLGAIHTGMSEEAFSQRSRGDGGVYWKRLCLRIPCPDFRVELTAGSMTSHYRQFHGTETFIDWD